MTDPTAPDGPRGPTAGTQNVESEETPETTVGTPNRPAQPAEPTRGGWVRCRLCGYVTRRAALKGGCPACGAPGTAFTPHAPRVPPRVRKLLGLDVHPILTHFSVGSPVLMAALFAGSLVWPDVLGIPLGPGGVLDFFVLLFPVAVLATALSGIFDGKLRYNTLATPFLRRKIGLGSALLVVAVVILVLHQSADLAAGLPVYVVEGVLILTSVGMAAALGWVGGKLTCNLVPRK